MLTHLAAAAVLLGLLALVILLVGATAFVCGRVVLDPSERIPVRELGRAGVLTTIWRGLCLLPRGWCPAWTHVPPESIRAEPQAVKRDRT